MEPAVAPYRKDSTIMRTIFLLSLSAVALTSVAGNEFTSSKVKLLAHFNLASLGAKSGNTCWGYVSKSGKEYALMGCSNKTVVFDVSNWNDCKKVAEVPHSEGLWSDIKIYKDTMYVSSETSGTGIQVVDLSKIDSGQATLVKTITTPGRSHTIAVDPDGPFLYTCGSNEGVSKGATCCFDIKDPNDPKRVGAPTMTPVYQHESQVVTYKSGKYKGKTVFFGGGEGRGLEIWDVTDKNKPTLIRRVAYPFVGYCHQGWLDQTMKYFYVNDEFDESTNSIATRTLVFDVSDLEKADLVSTYTTSKLSIDHNLYTRNGFNFHANYTSGLWIFDANDTPMEPKLCGFFDTYPADDKAHFDGAWSNYPLLPSGVVLISDINEGLFVVDATEATKTPVKASAAAATGIKGTWTMVTIGESDDEAGEFSGSGTGSVVLDAKAKWVSPSKVGFELKASSGESVGATVEFYNWKTKKFEQANSMKLDSSSTEFSVSADKAANLVESGTKNMKVKVTLKGSGAWKVSLDKARWTINP